MINLGLDMDDTITRSPEHFRILSHAVKKAHGCVHVISSRTNDDNVLAITKVELDGMAIAYDEVYLLPTMVESDGLCPHKGLDWYKKYLWMKVTYCKKHKITVYYDDDQMVIDLFRRYAPRIQVFKSCK